ncbi:MAG: hypothetical protein HN348_09625 [Proteobacteria bacterium]|jgi:Ca-activated chloride channel homolog|nr:hypothetical protein [Pseudomonadota bacterium]
MWLPWAQKNFPPSPWPLSAPSEAGRYQNGGKNPFSIVKHLAAEGITLSVVALGQPTDRDVPFLQDLAEKGRGRFHLTSDAADLKALFMEETKQLVDPGLEESGSHVALKQWHPVLRDVDLSTAPLLYGYNKVLPRPRSRVVLEALPHDEPLLAIWQRGLGQVAAVTTDGGSRWAADWLRWEGYQRFWTQLARHTMPSGQRGSEALDIETNGSKTTVRVTQRTTEGLSAMPQGISAQVTCGDKVLDRELKPSQPGVWSVEFLLESQALCHVEDVGESGDKLGERDFYTRPSSELAATTINERLLSDLEKSTAKAKKVKGTDMIELWPWLLLLAALMLPVDAFARRIVH